MNYERATSALDSTFGCLFLAAILSTALWGVGCCQVYFYYERFSKSDKWQLKAYIPLVWAIDTVHQALLIQSLYIYFVKEYGNFLYLLHPQRTLIDEVIFAALVDTMVQLLFVIRVWHLSNMNYLVTSVLVTVVLAQLGVTLSYFGQVYNITEATQLLTRLGTERAMNALVVVADTFIAVTLIYLLWNRRSGVRKTDSLIKQLVIYTIGTGLVTSLWGVVGIVGAQVLPASFIYLLVDLVMPKLYFNCMLASLNARSALRRTQEGDCGGVSIRLDNLPHSSNSRVGESERNAHKGAIARAIDSVVSIDRDPTSDRQKAFERNMSESDVNTV